MPRQAIQQATCTECDENNDNYTVTDSEITADDEGTRIEYSTRCECGTIGGVTIDEDGVSETDEMSHENASWNEDGASDESPDSE